MQLTKNFHLKEFHCKDGTPVPLHLLANVKALAKNLQVLRDHLGVPLIVISAYRSPRYNRAVGGVPGSQHPKGKAADIKSYVYTPKKIHAAVEQLITEGKMEQGGVGLYDTFVHYDNRGKKARW